MDLVGASRTGQMRAEVMRKPDLIRTLFPRFDEQVRSLLPHELCFRVERVMAAGSGDSHDAALATEMLFETVARLPMEALTGMHLARYGAPWLPVRAGKPPLVIGISVSGEVARTIELVTVARTQGAVTMALTHNITGRLARAAELVFNTSVPPPVEPPHVVSYLSSLMAMIAIALRLAEVRETISQEAGEHWRRAVLHAADVVAATAEQHTAIVRQAVRQLSVCHSFVFAGSGPNYGTALFGAAKIVEAAGQHAMGQDIEEWAHLQRFTREQGTPTFLIAPPGLSYRRAVELSRYMKQVGKFLIAVVEEGEREISRLADVVLPICGHVPEALTPLVYCTPLEMFASDLAQVLNEPYMRALAGPWSASENDPVIRGGEILSGPEQWRPDEVATR
jgi:glucosamine--fructose-6-phosphate aminotransferase (isomerizing)